MGMLFKCVFCFCNKIFTLTSLSIVFFVKSCQEVVRTILYCFIGL
nr:MAG TPA: hypothetical protein [Caudoviricetes sp.]